MITTTKIIDYLEDWYPRLNGFDGAPRYSTRRDAEQAAKSMELSISSVVRIIFLFEIVWMVGTVDSQPSEIAGVVQDVLRLPMSSFTGDKRNVATFRKFRDVRLG
ncbi:MAG: hypothetical protein HQL75_00170 [Magnetococcales bacterium]|nr:hypothetical protein [Magnetococcales bacterium]